MLKKLKKSRFRLAFLGLFIVLDGAYVLFLMCRELKLSKNTMTHSSSLKGVGEIKRGEGEMREAFEMDLERVSRLKAKARTMKENTPIDPKKYMNVYIINGEPKRADQI